MSYQLIEKDARVHAVDANGVEICGARQPYGHTDWRVYMTLRLTPNLHQVIALTRDAAVEHVRMLADMYTALHPASPAPATHFDAVDVSGACAHVESEAS